MPHSIETLRPFLGQTVYAYTEDSTCVPGVLRAVLLDDSFTVRCVVDHGEDGVRQYLAADIDTEDEGDDDEPFDPETDYDERYNYTLGSSATGLSSCS